MLRKSGTWVAAIIWKLCFKDADLEDAGEVQEFFKPAVEPQLKDAKLALQVCRR